jgi:hypothetical protein
MTLPQIVPQVAPCGNFRLRARRREIMRFS